MSETKRKIPYFFPIAGCLWLFSLTACERIFPSYEMAAMRHVPAAAPEPEVKRAEPRNLHTSVLIEAHPDSLPEIAMDPKMRQAMDEQAKYLRRPDVARYPVTGISKADLLKTVEILKNCERYSPEVLKSEFEFFRINTDLKSDKVRITGYYTPVIEASRTRSGPFQHPLLCKPGAAKGGKQELAWLKSAKEVKNAQLQGSCMVQFPDGERQYFGFGGSDRSSGKAYVYFTPVDNVVLGSGFFPLTPGYSIAVDPRYIPVGSTLLAELPEMDASGKRVGYTYRIVFAQDRGGAILTTKRIDLYCGLGEEALADARRINGYGRLWLLLPK